MSGHKRVLLVQLGIFHFKYTKWIILEKGPKQLASRITGGGRGGRTHYVFHSEVSGYFHWPFSIF